jgi:hypothetical protein
MFYINGIWLATGDSNKIAYSLDEGVTWEFGSQHSTSEWYNMAYGEGRFVAADTGGYISISTDGINWKDYPKITDTRLRSIVYGDNAFLVVNSLTVGPGVLISRLPFVKTDGTAGYISKYDTALAGVAPTGSLSDLTTTDKSSIIAAINEINAKLTLLGG